MYFIRIFFLIALVVAIPFEERYEKIQTEILRFVELYRTGRVDIQVWDMNEPSTSSANASKTTRHHIIPADTLRDGFLNMLSNRDHWPFMVQMLNAALENLRHEDSRIHIDDIRNAQNTLDMFDARIDDCEMDMDKFNEGLELLLAIFYWTPFNIYYGPAPHLRAPADPGNRRDKDYSSGFDIITSIISQLLEEQFKNSDISDLTVKMYILLLLVYAKPPSAGKFKEISPTFDIFVDNYLKYDLNIEPYTAEYEQALLNMTNTNRTIILQILWLSEMDLIDTCNNCSDNAMKSVISEHNKNYKCTVKKCPFFSGNTKYILTSDVELETFLQLGMFFVIFLIPMILRLLFKSRHSVPSQIRDKWNDRNDDNDDSDINGRRSYSKNPMVEKLKQIFFATENLDYEYKRCYDTS